MISELRPYQLEALAAIRDSLRGGVRRLMVQAATGAGKTKLAAAMVDSALSKGNRMAFVVPAIALVDQTVESFWAEGIRDVGVIQGRHVMEDWSRPIQVCSIQSIQSRGVFPQAGAVIFDEAHRLHEAHKSWMAEATCPIIGLSATPWARGLGKHFDSLLIAATTSDLIEQGYLSPFRVFASGHPDLSAVKTVAGDYHEGQLSDAMQDGELTADIIKTWKEKWGQGKTLCFAVDKAHARSIQERFEQDGVACGYQDANTLPDERKEIKRKFHNGEFPVVVNIQTLTTGVDWDCRCLILARPTRSRMLFVQIIGRALRTAPGKDYALILDHSDTTPRLGFVTDIHYDRLDDGTKDAAKKLEAGTQKAPLPKECKQCGCLKSARICPGCGDEPKPLSCGPIENAGELVEVTPGRQATHKAASDGASEQRAFLAQLKAHAILRGFKPAWASVKYKERYKHFPPRDVESVGPAGTVSPNVAGWIKSRQIAWVKSKRRSELMAADA